MMQSDDKMIVSNSSPLILLAKINQLNLLMKLYSKVHIPYEVYQEVIVKGKQEHYSDAAIIERHINEFIFIIDLDAKHKHQAESLKNIIGSGESEALTLCMQKNAQALLIDNLEPRKIAQVKGICCKSTPGILLEALKTNIITWNEYESAIKELSRHAWLSGDVVAYFLAEGYKRKGGRR